MKKLARPLAILAFVLAVSACASRPPSPVPSAPPVAADEPDENAIESGFRLVAFTDIPGWRSSDAAPALAAFRKSCRAVIRRPDPSRLAISDDWLAPCAAAPAATDARAFFEASFTPVVVAGGDAFITGYYEPEIEGCRIPTEGCNTPVYAPPEDLVRVERPDPENPGKTRLMKGMVDAEDNFSLYYDRAAIDAGALAKRGLEIAYAKDPVELFFLQIQGSGRLRLPGGDVMRIGYADQNGREYVGIGRRLKEIEPEWAGGYSMQGIMSWLRAHPDRGRALMHENKSYVFFQELTGEGPLGAMGAPVTPEVSLATDPRYVPLGAPVFLTTEYLNEARVMTPFRKLMVAQDTGGAIKGTNRFDLFWGAGERARTIAGGLASRGSAVILIPNSAAERLRGRMLIASADLR